MPRTVLSSAVSVLVVDDHPVVGTGVVSVLRGSRAHVIGHATTIEQAVRATREHQPDVILLDLRMGEGVLSVSSVGDLQAAAPGAKIVLFTAFPEHPAVATAIQAGAVGCLVKDIGHNDLVDSIVAVAEGRPLEQLSATCGELGLSSREYEILVRVSMGETNTEIGRELMLAPNTVKTYWQSALAKLGARNRADAICRAYRAGIL